MQGHGYSCVPECRVWKWCVAAQAASGYTSTWQKPLDEMSRSAVSNVGIAISDPFSQSRDSKFNLYNLRIQRFHICTGNCDRLSYSTRSSQAYLNLCIIITCAYYGKHMGTDGLSVLSKCAWAGLYAVYDGGIYTWMRHVHVLWCWYILHTWYDTYYNSNTQEWLIHPYFYE